jgi:hypothetical protein
MNKEDIDEIVDTSVHRHQRPEREARPNDGLRQVLNIIFMIGAVIGMIVYFFGNKTIGTIIILVAMLFKIVECVFRFKH